MTEIPLDVAEEALDPTFPGGDVAQPDSHAHATHAAASRERRDLATGEVMDEARLIRFVATPDGGVAPDLSRKLPGRGLWVEATRSAVTTAVKRDAFSRGAKTKLKPPADLADLVDRLLAQRVLAGLGLARRAGELISGFEKTASAIGSGRAAWWIEASDASADGRRKLYAHVLKSPRPPRVFAVFDSEALGLALGLDNAIHGAFLAGRGAERWTRDVRRLSGFRPLLPESWREGP